MRHWDIKSRCCNYLCTLTSGLSLLVNIAARKWFLSRSRIPTFTAVYPKDGAAGAIGDLFSLQPGGLSGVPSCMPQASQFSLTRRQEDESGARVVFVKKQPSSMSARRWVFSGFLWWQSQLLLSEFCFRESDITD